MSEPEAPRDRAGQPREQASGVPTYTVPNAERYVLEADALRRRQLRSALLHGSRRTWREHRRTWPAVVVGLVVVAVILAAMAVAYAFDRKAEIDAEEEEDAASAAADDHPSSGQSRLAPPIMAAASAENRGRQCEQVGTLSHCAVAARRTRDTMPVTMPDTAPDSAE